MSHSCLHSCLPEPEARSGGGSSRGSAGADEATGAGGQVAVPSLDGEVIYAGCRGALLALRRSDLALLDVHKVRLPCADSESIS